MFEKLVTFSTPVDPQAVYGVIEKKKLHIKHNTTSIKHNKLLSDRLAMPCCLLREVECCTDSKQQER